MVNGEKVTQSALTPFPITDLLLRTTAYMEMFFPFHR